MLSWQSYGLLSIEVLAFSGTDRGIRVVRNHPSHPSVHIVMPCPTIGSEFPAEAVPEIQKLCMDYDPIDKDAVESLGYLGSGALIAFEHGVPNNVPRMLIVVESAGLPSS